MMDSLELYLQWLVIALIPSVLCGVAWLLFMLVFSGAEGLAAGIRKLGAGIRKLGVGLRSNKGAGAEEQKSAPEIEKTVVEEAQGGDVASRSAELGKLVDRRKAEPETRDRGPHSEPEGEEDKRAETQEKPKVEGPEPSTLGFS